MNQMTPPAPQSDGHTDWPPTRAEGLARIARFRPRMGRAYAQTRNFDRGPERRDNVSLLSPYLRRRLVTEQEAVAAALGAHGAAQLLEELAGAAALGLDRLPRGREGRPRGTDPRGRRAAESR
jgi:deoxyribodipyrimidine photolyase